MSGPWGMIAWGDGGPPNSCGGGLNTPMTLYGTPWMWMRWPTGSIRSNNSSASFWLTTATWAAAASSTSVKERPGETSPPATLGHAALRPKIRTLRSEEHTSELQSQSNLVCRLLLEKKNTINQNITY